jgi:hypothetical protein
MSERTKKIVLISTGCVMLAVGSWWAYTTFTTVPPPPLATAKPQEVSNFLGNPRGYARMGFEARERYLAETLSRFSEGPARQELGTAFAKMSTREKQVFVDATIETAKKRFLDHASEFNRLPKSRQSQYVDNMIMNFEAQRAPLAGGGGTDNLGEAFKSMVPTTTDGMTKALVSKTNSRQRAKAQPLFDAVAVRYKELKDSGKLQ